MAKEIAKLFVTIGVEDKDFKSQLKAIDKSITVIGKTAMVAGAAIVGGMALAVKSYAETAHRVEILSEKTGLSLEMTQKYGYAAEVTGASIDSLGIAIKRMDVLITGADEGTKSANKTLAQLGLTIGGLKGLSPDQQFEQFALAIADIEDPALKSAMAVAVFGRSGTDILPMLADGADGLKKLTDAAVIMSDEQVKSGAELQDTIEHTKASWKCLVNTLGAAVGPAIKGYLDLLDKAIGSVSDLGKKNPQLTSTLSSAALSFGVANVALGGFILAAPKVISAVTSLTKTMKMGTGTFLTWGGGIVAALTIVGTAVSLWMQANEKIEEREKLRIAMIKEEQKALAGLKNEYYDATIAYVDNAEAMLKSLKFGFAEKDEWLKELKVLRERATAYKELKDSQDAAAISNEEINTKLATMIEKAKYASTAANILGVSIDDITKYMVDAGRETELFGLDWNFIGEDANRMAHALGINIADVAESTKTLARETAVLQAQYNAQVGIIDEYTARATGANQDQIDAIDAEIKAHRDANEAKSQQDRIAELQNQIAQETNTGNLKIAQETDAGRRKELEKELADSIKAQEKELADYQSSIIEGRWEDEMLARRQGLQDEITDIQDNSQKIKDSLAAKLQDEIDNLGLRKVELDKFYAGEDLQYQDDLKAFTAAADAKLEVTRKNALALNNIENPPEYTNEQGQLITPPAKAKPWWKMSGLDVLNSLFPSYAGWNGPVPGPMGAPYPAIVHGGEIISQPGSRGAGGINNTFNLYGMVVREEADVQRIARELYRMQQRKN